MKTMGMLATALFMGATVVGTVVAVRSIPELKRYLKIRGM